MKARGYTYVIWISSSNRYRTEDRTSRAEDWSHWKPARRGTASRWFFHRGSRSICRTVLHRGSNHWVRDIDPKFPRLRTLPPPQPAAFSATPAKLLSGDSARLPLVFSLRRWQRLKNNRISAIRRWEHRYHHSSFRGELLSPQGFRSRDLRRKYGTYLKVDCRWSLLSLKVCHNADTKWKKGAEKRIKTVNGGRGSTGRHFQGAATSCVPEWNAGRPRERKKARKCPTTVCLIDRAELKCRLIARTC